MDEITKLTGPEATEWIANEDSTDQMDPFAHGARHGGDGLDPTQTVLFFVDETPDFLTVAPDTDVAVFTTAVPSITIPDSGDWRLEINYLLSLGVATGPFKNVSVQFEARPIPFGFQRLAVVPIKGEDHSAGGSPEAAAHAFAHLEFDGFANGTGWNFRIRVLNGGDTDDVLINPDLSGWSEHSGISAKSVIAATIVPR